MKDLILEKVTDFIANSYIDDDIIISFMIYSYGN